MQKRNKLFLGTLIIVIIIVAGVILTLPSPSYTCESIQPATSFFEDFETLPSNETWGYEIQSWDQLEIVNYPVYHGNSSIKFTIKPGIFLNKGARSEISLKDSDPLCTEVWYQWAILIPEDYVDNYSARWTLVGQWHDQPDVSAGESWDTYPGHSPMIGLYYGANSSMSGIALHYGIGDDNRYVGHFEIKKGQWYVLKFHILWSRSSEGFCEAWVNNQSFLPFNGGDHKVYGPNMYNNAPAYLKIGIYRDPFVNTTNSVYFDDLRRSATEEGLSNFK